VTEPAGGEIDGLGFDEVIARLRAVVERLEQGNLGLEESLRAYEEGVGLARRGHVLLDGAEKRVELLVRARPGAAATVAPLDPEAEGERDGGE
jgi:exodeoxyribonuclease VII small subunit